MPNTNGGLIENLSLLSHPPALPTHGARNGFVSYQSSTGVADPRRNETGLFLISRPPALPTHRDMKRVCFFSESRMSESRMKFANATKLDRKFGVA